MPYKTCLLIDDNRLDIFINTRVIKTNNYADEIMACEDAEEALNLLKHEKVKPDVIFVDINMPVMDGFQFLDEYEKLNIDKSRTKIYMLSSSINPADLERAKHNKYVTCFLNKSLTASILSELES